MSFLSHRAVRNDSDVDLMVVGTVSFGEVVDALGGVQTTLGREVNPTVYVPAVPANG